MRWRRLLRWALLACGLGVFTLGGLVGGFWWYFHPACTRSRAIVYAQRQGQDLSYEMVRPAQPNGVGLILMVSGGWRSRPTDFRPWVAASLLRRGYTVFAVSHLSQPRATVAEIVADANRAVRHIRCHAGEYGIDPSRLGVCGGSAGGHLSLMVATRGCPGPADAPDPVDRASSAVQAVAIFYPVTDLLNLGASTENPGNGGPPKSFVKAFGPGSTNLAVWKVVGRDLSPIYHLTTNLPPTFIIHGGADTLTPLDQSERFQKAARALGCTVELEVRPGCKHGWLTLPWDVRELGRWFDRHLLAASQAAPAARPPRR